MTAVTQAQWVRGLAEKLARALELQPIAPPNGLEAIDGAFRGGPVQVRAQAWSGPRVAYLRVVTVEGGGLDIGNLLAFGAPEWGLPILGADLVSAGPDRVFGAMDLSPVSARGAIPHPGALAGAAQLGCAELPEWAARWFSKHAVSARLPKERSPELRDALEAHAEAFGALVRWATPNADADAVRVEYRRYCVDHLDADRGLGLLAKIVPADRAAALLERVMFPVERMG